MTWDNRRFRAPEDLVLPERPAKSIIYMDTHPEEFTVEQLLVKAVMDRYGLSRAEVAVIMNRSQDAINSYFLLPASEKYHALPPNFHALLEAWCRQHKQAIT